MPGLRSLASWRAGRRFLRRYLLLKKVQEFGNYLAHLEPVSLAEQLAKEPKSIYHLTN